MLFRVGKLQFIGLTRMNINEKINEIINVQLMIINVQNNARSAPKLKRKLFMLCASRVVLNINYH